MEQRKNRCQNMSEKDKQIKYRKYMKVNLKILENIWVNKENKNKKRKEYMENIRKIHKNQSQIMSELDKQERIPTKSISIYVWRRQTKKEEYIDECQKIWYQNMYGKDNQKRKEYMKEYKKVISITCWKEQRKSLKKRVKKSWSRCGNQFHQK